LKIFRAKGPSVRNYLSNKVDSLKPPWRWSCFISFSTIMFWNDLFEGA
jgi:hypothetical protein